MLIQHKEETDSIEIPMYYYMYHQKNQCTILHVPPKKTQCTFTCTIKKPMFYYHRKQCKEFTTAVWKGLKNKYKIKIVFNIRCDYLNNIFVKYCSFE